MENFGVLYYKNLKIVIGEVNNRNTIGQVITPNNSYFGSLVDGKR